MFPGAKKPEGELDISVTTQVNIGDCGRVYNQNINYFINPLREMAFLPCTRLQKKESGVVQ